MKNRLFVSAALLFTVYLVLLPHPAPTSRGVPGVAFQVTPDIPIV